ncbi:MAG: tetratricopeptide repeat protein [Planctomyces sp.]
MASQLIQKRLQHAYERHVSGDSGSAAAIYAEVLTQDPNNADAWHLSGLVAFQQRRFDDAESLIRRALHIRPEEPAYEANLAAALLANGKSAEAENRCRRILRVDPSHVDAMRHLGTALRNMRRTEEAAEVCEAVVRTRPADVDALCNLGAVLADIGRIDEAHRTLLKARSINSGMPQIHLNLGAIQRQLGHFDDAMVSLNRATELAPNLSEAATNRGNLLLEMGRPDQALVEFERALSINPDSCMALSGIGQALQVLGRWSEAMEAFRLACQSDSARNRQQQGSEIPGDNPVRRRLISNMLYCSTLVPELDREAVSELHRSWGVAIENSVPAMSHRIYQDPEKRLRIGYLSPDFRNHATMKFFLPFLRMHNRTHFEILCYSETVRNDETTTVVQNLADQWKTTNGLSDTRLSEIICSDQIDILVDLAGHTAGNRLGAMAFRPAPLQVSFLGYPGTTGLTRVDYFLSDEKREDENTANSFTEQLVLMPHGACCFDPGTRSPEIDEPPVLENGYITLGSTHRLEKISPQCLQVWSQVMNAIPDARLLIIRDVLGSSALLRNNLRRQLSAAGISNDRVDLEWNIPSDHLQIYSRFDILLDVFPWPSGTTAYEAMWMGVPIPAITGTMVRSRQTASFMHFAGCPHLVSDSVESYPELVADLAIRLGDLCEMRRSLRDRMKATVCNGKQFARDLESVYRQMWRRYCGVAFDQGQLRILSPAAQGVCS